MSNTHSSNRRAYKAHKYSQNIPTIGVQAKHLEAIDSTTDSNVLIEPAEVAATPTTVELLKKVYDRLNTFGAAQSPSISESLRLPLHQTIELCDKLVKVGHFAVRFIGKSLKCEYRSVMMKFDMEKFVPYMTDEEKLSYAMKILDKQSPLSQTVYGVTIMPESTPLGPVLETIPLPVQPPEEKSPIMPSKKVTIVRKPPVRAIGETESRMKPSDFDRTPADIFDSIFKPQGQAVRATTPPEPTSIALPAASEAAMKEEAVITERMTALVENLRVKEMRVLFTLLNSILKH